MSRMARIASLALTGMALFVPTAAAKAPFTAHRVPFQGHTLYARDYPGSGPALVLMHGFPATPHLSGRLVPDRKGRHVVTFAFLGWGRSDKPRDHTYTFAEQEAELDAIAGALHLGD